jgi:hypothetical protein
MRALDEARTRLRKCPACFSVERAQALGELHSTREHGNQPRALLDGRKSDCVSRCSRVLSARSAATCEVRSHCAMMDGVQQAAYRLNHVDDSDEGRRGKPCFRLTRPSRWSLVVAGLGPLSELLCFGQLAPAPLVHSLWKLPSFAGIVQCAVAVALFNTVALGGVNIFGQNPSPSGHGRCITGAIGCVNFPVYAPMAGRHTLSAQRVCLTPGALP